MPYYTYQYRREQRAEFEIEAETETEAQKLAEAQTELLKLDSIDDTSDDDGELELIDAHYGDKPEALGTAGARSE